MARVRNRWAIAATFVALCIAAMTSGAVGAAQGTGASSSAAAAAPSQITIVQTPSGGGGLCLPPIFSLQSATASDATSFTLQITVTAPLCDRLNVVAAVYRMPGDGVAWPQQLLETKGFTLKEPGVTVVTFAKTCDAVQFDVVTGATPPEISPLGPWHGPLLFPFDTSTAEQFWGCGPTPTTTTTTPTTSTTTTTIADDCDGYTPTGVTASPSVVSPGQAVNVTGTGTPGTAIQVILRPSGSPDISALSDPTLVGPDGRWATVVYVPTAATPGTWVIAAQAVDCETETTTQIQVVAAGTATTTPPSTEAPVVAGEVVVRDLPQAAVATPAGQNPQVEGTSVSAPANTSGLAFTGGTPRLFVGIGAALIACGGLLLLRQRRRTA